MRRRVRFLLARAAIAVAAILLALALFVLLLRMRVDPMRAELKVACGITESFESRYPTRTEPNEAALRLEELSPELGINFVPMHRRTNRVTSKVGGDISDFAYDEWERKPWLQPTEGPNAVVEYLNSHKEMLSGVLDLKTPKWENDFHDPLGFEGPQLALVNLQRVLFAWMLVEAREGRDDEALRILDLSWQLCLSLRKEPSLESRLLGVSFERQLVAALLRLEAVPEKWFARLADMSHTNEVQELFLADVLAGVEFTLWVLDSEGALGATGIEEPMLLDAALGAASTIKATYPPQSRCALGDEAESSSIQFPTSWWNVGGSDLARAVGRPWAAKETHLRAKRLQTEAELASLWFQRDGYEPEARIPSRSCEGLTFVFSLADDGRRALHFEGEHSFDTLQGFPVITRMEERPSR